MFFRRLYQAPRPARDVMVTCRSQEAQGTPGGCGSGDDHQQPQEGQGHRGAARPWQDGRFDLLGTWLGNDGDMMVMYISG